MLTTEKDLYNGLIIDSESTLLSLSDFKQSLKKLLQQSKEDKIALLWLDLTSQQHEHIAIALALGFAFHNCEAHRVTLTFQVTKDAYIPVPPTHTIGVGAVVTNNKNEVLVVRDKISSGHSYYKFPGGMLEEASSLEDGVIREVYEETGIKAKLTKMVSLLNSHPYRFNKSNIYIVFQLEALNEEINIIDTHEIAEALWLPIDEFLSREDISQYQKDLFAVTQEHEGLTQMRQELYFKNKKHLEVYG